MYALKGEENTAFFQSLHFTLQNMPQNGKKESGKGGAEFPPDPLSAPAAFRRRLLKENRRDDLSSHHGCCTESLEQVLKIWLLIFFKKSSNFGQKTQPTFTFCKIIRGSPGVLRLVMVFFRYDPGIFKVAHQHAIGNAKVSALKRSENKVFRTNLFLSPLAKGLSVFLFDCPKAIMETIWIT